MATVTKNATKYQPSDWFTSNFAVSTNAERSRNASHQVRHESRQLRNEAAIKTKWDQHDNNTRLADRIEDIRKWRDIVEKALEDLNREITDLSEAKNLTELALANMEVPTDVNVENLTLRDMRTGIDLVQDEAELELKKEQELIAKIKQQLQQKCNEAFEQLCQLQETRQQILQDLHDKESAIDIDTDQYNLSEKSPNISFKPDPCRITPSMTTPQQWEDFSRYNKERADAEIRASTRLREAIHHTLHQTANDLEAQRQAVDYAFRRRLHETERAKKELEWQKKNTENEIADIEADISAVEAQLEDIKPAMKLAQTRAENRLTRPGVENVRDSPQYGLCDEMHQIKNTKEALEEKLRQLRHHLDGLENNLHRINEELANKNLNLELDRRNLATREKLTVGRSLPQGTDKIGKPLYDGTDANLCLTGIQRDRSQVLQ